MSDSPPEPNNRAGEIAGDLFRHQGARIVAMLTAQLGVHRLQLAEDVVQEALVRALQTWPYRCVPDNPAAWLMQTAKNLALDTLRREMSWQEKASGIAQAYERWLGAPATAVDSEGGFVDDTLRMMFVCFHPQLSAEAQTALALRTLCGLSPAEIAAAFLTSEAAIAKRLVRARQRIRELALPFAVPDPKELPARLDGVLGTLYLLFNEGYKASSGDRLVREELCHEAIRLAQLLAEHPATNQPRIHALLALMLLNAARLAARTDDAGNLLRLHEQDRAAWNQTMIQRGIQHLALAATGDALSEYHLEAGIAACHSTAAGARVCDPQPLAQAKGIHTAELGLKVEGAAGHSPALRALSGTMSGCASTDWPRILSLYDRLVKLNGSPIVALNRAVAVARVHGSQAGLDALDAILARISLESYHLYHAVRGAFAAELGRNPEAILHFRKAETLATLPSEREFISRRIRECERAGQN